MNKRYFAADEADAGERVDRWIAGAAEDLSRSVVQRLCDDGAVFADGKAVAKNYRLRGGEELAVEVPDAKPLDVVPTTCWSSTSPRGWSCIPRRATGTARS